MSPRSKSKSIFMFQAGETEPLFTGVPVTVEESPFTPRESAVQLSAFCRFCGGTGWVKVARDKIVRCTFEAGQLPILTQDEAEWEL